MHPLPRYFPHAQAEGQANGTVDSRKLQVTRVASSSQHEVHAGVQNGTAGLWHTVVAKRREAETY
jgi:hypothetical protein